jgi:hypothetical protein
MFNWLRSFTAFRMTRKGVLKWLVVYTLIARPLFFMIAPIPIVLVMLIYFRMKKW